MTNQVLSCDRTCSTAQLGGNSTEFKTGAYLEEVPKEGDALKIQGSAMVAFASSKEEVIEQLKADIYAKNEVWDFEKASSLGNLVRN